MTYIRIELIVYYINEMDDALESLLNYCYEHADRPNPIQDLVDKGFLSSNMTGITCAEVRQMDDRVQIAIKVVNEKLEQYNKLILQETGEYGAPVKPYEKDCYFHQALNKKICPNDSEFGK